VLQLEALRKTGMPVGWLAMDRGLVEELALVAVVLGPGRMVGRDAFKTMIPAVGKVTTSS
jgi:hypothetical protein